jgi:hypothetical protein
MSVPESAYEDDFETSLGGEASSRYLPATSSRHAPRAAGRAAAPSHRASIAESVAYTSAHASGESGEASSVPESAGRPAAQASSGRPWASRQASAVLSGRPPHRRSTAADTAAYSMSFEEEEDHDGVRTASGIPTASGTMTDALAYTEPDGSRSGSPTRSLGGRTPATSMATVSVRTGSGEPGGRSGSTDIVEEEGEAHAHAARAPAAAPPLPRAISLRVGGGEAPPATPSASRPAVGGLLGVPTSLGGAAPLELRASREGAPPRTATLLWRSLREGLQCGGPRLVAPDVSAAMRLLRRRAGV